MSSRDLVVAAAGASGPSDPNFKNVSLLLSGDGTNGAQNNTFLDSSTNNFTITRNGNTTQGTFSPYGDLWSNYFGANTSNRISAPANAAFAFGTGAFTVEAWIFVYDLSQENFVFDTRSSVSTAGVGFSIEPNTGKLRYSGNANNVLTSTAITANTWNHVAWVYNGTTLTGYINGVSGGTATPSFNITQNNGQIGNVPFSAVPTAAYLSSVRVVKGTALYTSNFTPSTTPLTAVSGTSLLTCQSNRFIDNSSNNFTLTVNGNTSVQRFSPFNPTAPYSASTIGGSGYFDGSGDYLTCAASATQLGSGDFTVEGWIYPTTLSGVNVFLCNAPYNSNGFSFLVNYPSAGALTWYSNGSVVATVAGIATNRWYHVAAVRSGTALKLYINGNDLATSTNSTNYSASTLSYIGQNDSGEIYFGYISNLRVVKGTAVYTSAFTPPTSPVTAITNTSLLCNFTNAGIPDAAMMNDLETVGNAQVSTSVVKYGTGSLAFDGSGDRLLSLSTPQYDFGSGDWTIECWVYANNLSSPLGIICKRTNSDADYRWLVATLLTNGKINTTVSTTGSSWAIQTDSTSTVSATQWTHIAWVRNGSDVSVYIGGVKNTLSSSFSGSVYSGTEPLVIGANGTTGSTYFYQMNGYIDDLRITKGYARYTSNFTPPAQALPTQ